MKACDKVSQRLMGVLTLFYHLDYDDGEVHDDDGGFIVFFVYRNFANKLWNAGKFIQNCLLGISEDDALQAALVVHGPLSVEELMELPLPERFIVSKCHQLVAKVTLGLESYDFGDAGRLIYEFLWDEFADWYIEASKSRMRGSDEDALRRQQVTRRVLIYIWDTCMRLLHPFMPYLTETLWQLIPHEGESIMISQWPQLDDDESLAVDESAIRSFEALQALVRSIRNARAEYNVDPGKKIEVLLRLRPEIKSLIEDERVMFALLARVDDTLLQVLESIHSEVPSSAGPCVHLIVDDGVEAFLPQSRLIDKDKELQRLNKQAERLVKDISVLESRLQSKGFAEKAPESLVMEVKDKLRDMQEQLKAVQVSVNVLNA